MSQEHNNNSQSPFRTEQVATALSAGRQWFRGATMHRERRSGSRQGMPTPFAGRRIPPGKRIYAIGDIHGNSIPFERLIDLIANDCRDRPCENIIIILLGDLIDRGPDTRRVLEFVHLMRESALDVRAIMGNHEEVLLDLLERPGEELARFFWRIGGRETLESYGFRPEHPPTPEQIYDAARSLIPSRHLDVLRSMVDYVEIGDMFFTHAGIDPEYPIDRQEKKSLRWIREPFLSAQNRFEKLVIHGHTITSTPSLGVSRVGIDTGAFCSGVLTALALEEDRHWFLRTTPTPHPGTS